MVMQDVHKIVALQMKCNFTVEELQLIGRALETHKDAQVGNYYDATDLDAEEAQATALREWNATEALLTRIV